MGVVGDSACIKIQLTRSDTRWTRGAISTVILRVQIYMEEILKNIHGLL